jgi:hypothetical protein
LTPQDRYRTCFQRAADPSNNLSEDKVLREQYNIGAALYQNGEDISSPSVDTYLAPFTLPYAASDEKLTNGTVYLSLVSNNDIDDDMTCDEALQLEELALEWLKVSCSENLSTLVSPYL